ncbi:MAG TPA: hypothetical protein VF017_24140 [Thermoanaerobaculia bacterium]|nr:hypothetical protein [Thermoanaerobaculia bacterium]
MTPARWFFLAAGLCDAGTGLGLLVGPGLILRLMGVASGPSDPALLRFVGAFVLGVGLAYLLALVRPPRPGRLSAVAETTALLRFAVGGYVAVAVAAGTLPAAWATVAATDLGLAAAQVLLLSRGFFDEPR